MKSQLVIKGFQKENNIKSDSRTCNKESLSLIENNAPSNKLRNPIKWYKIWFLQSKHIDKDVKVNPLNEAGENPNKIWIFNTTIHDLTDTSRPQYMSVRQTFIDGCWRL